MKIGYACVNKTLLNEGVQYSELEGMFKILKWNVSKGIKMYRINNAISQHPEPKLLEEIGKFIKENDIKVSFHTDLTCVLSSLKPVVVHFSISHLEKLSEIMDMMNLEAAPCYKINTHIGSYKPEKEECADRFINNFMHLSKNCQQRITIENDDKAGGFTVKDLYHMVYLGTGTPIVFDYFHHFLNPGDLSEEEALKLAKVTWGDLTPTVHYADSRKIYEDSTVKSNMHADYIYQKIQTYGLDLDIMIESHGKELALLQYQEKFMI